MKKIQPLNPYDDGTARTIKAQYYKNGLANFLIRGGTEQQESSNMKNRCILVGNIYHGNPQAGRIYSPYGICPTISTCGGGNQEPKIMTEEPIPCAMRGRNPDNPSDRNKGTPTTQRIEYRPGG